jgi:hypothetical protein
MGLDMYLKAEKYVGGWNHRDGKDEFEAFARLTGVKPTERSPSFTVGATVGYWRKANAIHAWFVQNVQNGEDDCGTYDVSREQLQELRDLCASALAAAKVVDGRVHNGTSYKPGGVVEQHYERGKVIENPQEVAEILPTQSGFFFGSTDYDEGYISDLTETVVMIDGLLSNEKLNDWSFSYHSSW